MAQDGVEIGLSHTYTGNRFIWQAQLAYAALDAKEENPIFIEDHDVDRLNVSAFLLFPRAFGWQKWMPTVGLAYGEEDSNIDFYDSRTWIISAAVMRQF
jgi:hypothetical protein